jgi:hypothetical protein
MLSVLWQSADSVVSAYHLCNLKSVPLSERGLTQIPEVSILIVLPNHWMSVYGIVVAIGGWWRAHLLDPSRKMRLATHACNLLDVDTRQVGRSRR